MANPPANTPGTTTPDIDAGKAGNPLDIVDFAEKLNQIPELSRKSIEKTFRNFDDLQKDVATKQNSYQKDISKQAEAALTARTVREKNLALANIALLEKQKGEFDKVSASLQQVAEKEKAIAKERKESIVDGAKAAAGAVGLGGIIEFFSGGFSGMLAKTLGFIKDILVGANRDTVELGKNFQVSAEQAENIRQSLILETRNAEGFQAVLEYRIKAQQQLQENSKITLGLSKDQRDTQIEFVEQLGLSSQEGARLNELFTANNKEGSKGKGIIFDQVALFAKQTGYLFDTKKVLQDVSNVSGQIRATYKGSVEELTKAVMTAAKLGTTIEQTKSMSESLLNFESSIDNELKAELLTGQQLNLEKARSLALSGDYVGAGKVMLEQAGGLANFQRLNVIQQKALAEAVGLSADQMADILFKQTVQGKQANELAGQYRALGAEDMARALESGKIQGEQLETAKKRLNAEQEFALAMEQVKTALSSLVSGNFLSRLVDLVKDLARYVSRVIIDLNSGKTLAEVFISGPSKEATLIQAKQESDQIKNQLSTGGLSEKQTTDLTNRLSELNNPNSDIEYDRKKELSTVGGYTEVATLMDTLYGAIDPFNTAKDYEKTRTDEINQKYDSLVKERKQEDESIFKRLEKQFDKLIEVTSKGQTIVMDNKVVGKTNVGYLLEYGANKIG